MVSAHGGDSDSSSDGDESDIDSDSWSSGSGGQDSDSESCGWSDVAGSPAEDDPALPIQLHQLSAADSPHKARSSEHRQQHQRQPPAHGWSAPALTSPERARRQPPPPPLSTVRQAVPLAGPPSAAASRTSSDERWPGCGRPAEPPAGDLSAHQSAAPVADRRAGCVPRYRARPAEGQERQQQPPPATRERATHWPAWPTKTSCHSHRPAVAAAAPPKASTQHQKSQQRPPETTDCPTVVTAVLPAPKVCYHQHTPHFHSRPSTACGGIRRPHLSRFLLVVEKKKHLRKLVKIITDLFRSFLVFSRMVNITSETSNISWLL